MNITLAALCLAAATTVSRAQSVTDKNGGPMERTNGVSVYGGMGIALATAPGLVNYLNTLADPSEQVQTFSTDVEFFGGAELPVADVWSAGMEYNYLFKSYTLPTGGSGTYTTFYDVKMPTLIAHYVASGKGYFLKFGGGIGYHSGAVEQKSNFYNTDSTYTCHGIGIKLDGIGQTAFDEHLYAYIAADMRWELFGDLKDGQGDFLQNHGQTATLSMFVVGLAFGLTYYF